MNARGMGLGMLIVATLSGPGPVGGEELMRQEIPARFAPASRIKSVVQPKLSAEGRFVLLPEKGTVLVIDRPERVMAVAEALEAMEVPPPEIQLSLGLETGGRVRAAGSAGAAGSGGGSRVLGPVRARSDMAFPQAFLPPRIGGGGGGGYIVLPAHPTNFQRRNLGQTLEATPQVQADGSIVWDVKAENVEFAGFINYGSPILAPGGMLALPVASGLRNAPAFHPVIGGGIRMPVFETTRVSTSVVVMPEVEGKGVRLYVMPRLTLENERNGVEEREEVDLRALRSQLWIPQGEVARLRGFEGAPEDFNEHFFAPSEVGEGVSRMVWKATVRPREARVGGG